MSVRRSNKIVQSLGYAVFAGLVLSTLAACDGGTVQSTPVEPVRAADATPLPPALVEPAPIAVIMPITNEVGFAWAVSTTVDPESRKLRVFEDGKELGPSESLHEDIRKIGMGRYSHWKSTDGSMAVYFSTSDNSDPNSNGRVYELK